MSEVLNFDRNPDNINNGLLSYQDNNFECSLDPFNLENLDSLKKFEDLNRMDPNST